MIEGANGQTAARNVQVCLQRLSRSALPFGSRLADRVSTLAVAYADDYDSALSVRAIDGLVTFLEADASVGYPDVTATPAGDLYAEWRGTDGRKLSIEFLDSGDVRYLVFAPNPRHPQRTDRLSA